MEVRSAAGRSGEVRAVLSAEQVPASRALVLLALVLMLAGALRFAALGADPPRALSISNSEVTDGPWYLAEAVDRARGQPVGVPSHYRKPLLTASAQPFFAGGVSLERAHAWAASAGLLLVALAAGAAWTAYGSAVALLAALLLAIGMVPVGYGRAAVVYGPLAAGLAGVLWLYAAGLGRRPALVAAAWGALALLALGFKENAVLAAPGLLAGQLVLARRRARVLLVAAAALPAALLVLWMLDPHLLRISALKLRSYLGGHEPLAVLKRWCNAPFASGLAAKAPLVCAGAWLGVLLAFAVHPRGAGEPAARRERALDVTLAVWLVGWGAFHAAFEYLEGGPPPLRHFVGALVPAAVLAARALVALVRRGGSAWRVPAAPLFAWALAGGYWALGAAWQQAWPWLVPAGGGPAWLRALVGFEGLLGSAALLGAGAVCWSWRRGGVRLRLGAAPALGLALGLGCLHGARLVPMVVRPQWTLRDANTRLAELVGAGAVLYGPWAHALSWSHPGVARVLPPHSAREIAERSLATTHLVVDVAWTPSLLPLFCAAGGGAAPIPLGRVLVRDHPVALYRFPWAEQRLGYLPTPAEREAERAARARPAAPPLDPVPGDPGRG
ncbi:MAG: hypothetical protein KatS3mg102_0827 [Planctomycetota bacterium]|nr:MAG: hypothetical protein KatS3mg102_0827 [Planctomycetota bacterium]